MRSLAARTSSGSATRLPLAAAREVGAERRVSRSDTSPTGGAALAREQ